MKRPEPETVLERLNALELAVAEVKDVVMKLREKLEGLEKQVGK